MMKRIRRKGRNTLSTHPDSFLPTAPQSICRVHHTHTMIAYTYRALGEGGQEGATA